MSTLLSGIVKWLVRQAATLLLVLAVLLGGAWIGGQLKKADELAGDRAGLVAAKEALSGKIEALKRDAQDQSTKAGSVAGGLGAMLEQARTERRKLWDEHPWARKLPWSEAAIKIAALDRLIADYQATIGRVTRAQESREKELEALIRERQRELGRIDGEIAGIDRSLALGYGARVAGAIYRALPLALGVLAAIILLPIAIKIFLYFVAAPWVAHRPPIRLLPAASGAIVAASADATAGPDSGKMSAVSLPVVLGEREELLVQPEYLQSTSLAAAKQTRWLLHAGIPFSSLASGMFLLTRIGPAGSAPVVISATRDPLIEVGLLELAQGAAFVCQPRSLAGVIQDPDNPVRITRHWRLGSLQAWLTLQLRFLVFHGPGKLVLKGCRGIRIESAGKGRLINQAATLGFSASLAYANTRCETFVSYWTGKEDLFNDLFAGEPGVYVYEEMPDLKRTTGVTGRGIEGFADAVLKVFGV